MLVADHLGFNINIGFCNCVFSLAPIRGRRSGSSSLHRYFTLDALSDTTPACLFGLSAQHPRDWVLGWDAMVLLSHGS